jgi:hypothetical protein
MHGSLSPESKVAQAIEKLGCSLNAFAKIAGVPHPTLFKIINGNKSFDQSTAEGMLDLTDRMVELQDSVIAPIDWAKFDKVQNALATRMAMLILHESDDHQLDRVERERTDLLR